MITKKELKWVCDLQIKKKRHEEKAFVVEGKKSIEAFLAAGYQPKAIYGTTNSTAFSVETVNEPTMKRMSSLKNPSPFLAVFPIPTSMALPTQERLLVVDQLTDPGNLGTIIRLCDWFGIDHLLCSPQTVDCYNPKVVQATMGSLSRVKVHYEDLVDFFHENNLPVFGTYLEGESIYSLEFPTAAVLVLGSEAHGISEELSPFMTNKITIPRKSSVGPESLNVATAAAICLGHFCRWYYSKVKLITTPWVDNCVMLEVQGLLPLMILSGTNSSWMEKIPRIEGENLK